MSEGPGAEVLGETRTRTVGRRCKGSASLVAENERGPEGIGQCLRLSYSACLWGVGGREERAVCGGRT